MDDAGFMRRFKGFGNLLGDREGFVERNRPLLDAIRQVGPSTSSRTSARTPSCSSSP